MFAPRIISVAMFSTLLLGLPWESLAAERGQEASVNAKQSSADPKTTGERDARSGGGQTALKEIVITATKRPQLLQNVASAVSVVNADVLSQTGTVSMQDYSAQVPGLTFSNRSTDGSQNIVSIRGITVDGPNPTVDIYLDDVQLNFTTGSSNGEEIPDLDPADLEHIEVLAGPQGTLYGGGALGGIIRFVTKEPNFDTFSARTELDGSTVGHGTDDGYAVRASANLPVDSRVALSVSGFQKQDPGFMHNITTGQGDWGRTETHGGRLALGVKLSQNFNLRLDAYGEDSAQHGAPVIELSATSNQPIFPGLTTQLPPGDDFEQLKTGVYDARLEGDLDWAQLIAISSYVQQNMNGTWDNSPVLAPIIDSVFDVSNTVCEIPQFLRAHKYTEELRLVSPSSKSIEWMAGAIYDHEDSDRGQDVTSENATTGVPLPFSSLIGYGRLSAAYEEAAAYGDVTYFFTKEFDVTAGLRYSHTELTSVSSMTGLLFGTASTPGFESSDSTTFLVNPRYRFTDHIMGYLRIASGFTPGGPNFALVGVPHSYGPDHAVDYEAGIKVHVVGSLSFYAAPYYITWRQIQVTGLSSLHTNYTFNGGEAHSQGFDSSVTYQPLRGLTLAGNVAYIDAVLDQNLPPGNVGSKGDPLPYSPKWAGYVSADYSFPAFAGSVASVGTSYRYVGERPSDFTAMRYFLPSYTEVDLHAGLQYARYSVNLYVNNFADKRGYVTEYDEGPVREVSVTTPRTVGVALAATF